MPFFLWVREDPVPPDAPQTRFGLIDTIRNLPGKRSLLAYLGSSMLYRDALNGLFAFGGIYATGVLGWSLVQIGVFGIASLIQVAFLPGLAASPTGDSAPSDSSSSASRSFRSFVRSLSRHPMK